MHIPDAHSLSLSEQIGQLIMVGFHGTNATQPEVQKVIAQVRAGQIGGLALFRYNIIDANQLHTLVANLHTHAVRVPLFISIDQEGGRVQRLNSDNGFITTASARSIAKTCSIEAATQQYSVLGTTLHSCGINLDFAPCVDLDADLPENSSPVIGGIERAYSNDPAVVATFARCMITALGDQGVHTCLKHFPGHGRATGDTHVGLVDITKTWSEVELEPYQRLVAEGGVDMVMTAHLSHQEIDSGKPATLSRVWIDRLRNNIGFNGVVTTDCLHMGAMVTQYRFKDVVVEALNAGVDILLCSNNPLAANSDGIRHASAAESDYLLVNGWQIPDIDLPLKFHDIVQEAIASGKISKARVSEACQRVLNLKFTA